MDAASIASMVVTLGFLWGIVAYIWIVALNDIKNGKIWTGEYDRLGRRVFAPAKEVSDQQYVRAALWPITLVLLIPLGIILVIKSVYEFLAGIAGVYKENI